MEIISFLNDQVKITRVVRLRYDKKKLKQKDHIKLLESSDFIEQAYEWGDFFVIQFPKKYLTQFGKVRKKIPAWDHTFSVSMLKPELKHHLFL